VPGLRQPGEELHVLADAQRLVEPAGTNGHVAPHCHPRRGHAQTPGLHGPVEQRDEERLAGIDHRVDPRSLTPGALGGVSHQIAVEQDIELRLLFEYFGNRRKLVRQILVVAVKERDKWRGRGGDAAVAGRVGTVVRGLAKQAHPWVVDRGDQFGAVVARRVVDDDQFEVGKLLSQ